MFDLFLTKGTDNCTQKDHALLHHIEDHFRTIKNNMLNEIAPEHKETITLSHPQIILEMKLERLHRAARLEYIVNKHNRAVRLRESKLS